MFMIRSKEVIKLTSETKLWQMQDSAARTELTKDYCFSVGEAAKPPVRQVCWTESYCCQLSCTVLFVDFKQMHISLMLLLWGGKLRLSRGGGSLDCTAQRCRRSSKLQRASLFPIRGLSLSSRHWTQRKEEKQPIWDPFTFIILPGDWGDLPPSTSHTHISKHILLSWPHSNGQHELMDKKWRHAEVRRTNSQN